MASDFLTLLDWRRQISDLYADIRRQHAADPQVAHADWQTVRNELFAHHPQTPLLPESRDEFTSLPVWPYDPAFTFTAAVQTDMPSETFIVQTSVGHDMPLSRVGRVHLQNAVHDLGSLDVYWIDVYGGGLFVPFRDAGSGHSSYGGGRYLLDTVKGADLGSSDDGQLLLDFNFAYHPSCFYNSEWSCPLAPPQNVLGAEVRAGERSEVLRDE